MNKLAGIIITAVFFIFMAVTVFAGDTAAAAEGSWIKEDIYSTLTQPLFQAVGMALGAVLMWPIYYVAYMIKKKTGFEVPLNMQIKAKEVLEGFALDALNKTESMARQALKDKGENLSSIGKFNEAFKRFKPELKKLEKILGWSEKQGRDYLEAVFNTHKLKIENKFEFLNPEKEKIKKK